MVYKITFDGEKYKTSLVNKICPLKGQQKKTYEGETEFDYDMPAEWVRVQVDKLLVFVSTMREPANKISSYMQAIGWGWPNVLLLLEPNRSIHYSLSKRRMVLKVARREDTRGENLPPPPPPPKKEKVIATQQKRKDGNVTYFKPN